MKCLQCGAEIQGQALVNDRGEIFCNALHRLMRSEEERRGENKPASSPSGPDRSLIVRRVLLGIGYTIVLFFLGLMLGGAILGGIAGIRAQSTGGDPAAAGRITGTQFGQNWGWLVLLLSLAFVSVAVTKGWLPWTKKRKPA